MWERHLPWNFQLHQGVEVPEIGLPTGNDDQSISYPLLSESVGKLNETSDNCPCPFSKGA